MVFIRLGRVRLDPIRSRPQELPGVEGLNKYPKIAGGRPMPAIKILMALMIITFLNLSGAALGEDRSAEKKEIWGLETAYWEYIKKGDASGFNTLWHKDAVFWPQGLSTPIGKGAVEKLMIDQPGFKFLTYSLNLQGISFFENIAIVYYWYNLITTDKLIHSGRMEHIWIKQEGQWQIIGGFSGGSTMRE
jgi:hypothetical protein